MKKIFMLLLATLGLLTPAVHASTPYGEDITVSQARALVAEEAIVWIDVREVTEFEKLPKLNFVKHVPLSYFNTAFAELNVQPDTTVFVICRSGNRSKRVQSALQDSGYTAVTNILGGMSGWYQEFPQDSK